MATAVSNTIVKNVRNLISLDEACRVSVTHWFLAGSHVLTREVWAAEINPLGAAFRDGPSMTAK